MASLKSSAKRTLGTGACATAAITPASVAKLGLNLINTSLWLNSLNGSMILGSDSSGLTIPCCL